MIEHRKERCNWEFLFLGANIDAVKEAGRFGIKPNRAVRYEHDGFGTQLNYEVVSKVVTGARKAGSAREMNELFDDEALLADISADYKKRHK